MSKHDHITNIYEVAYLAALALKERSSVRDIQRHMGETMAHTLTRLLRMRDDGLICGEQLHNRQWMFWIKS